jgi:DNA-binding NarL/FixJ family response regulator
MRSVRVLLADDHVIVRQGLRRLLESDETMAVVGEAGDGREAVRLAEALHPDVIVMDLRMPGLDGLGATRRIRDRQPDIRIIALSLYEEESYARQALRAGVSGYVIKKAAYEELRLAIEAAMRDEIYVSAGLPRRLVEGYPEGVVLDEKQSAYQRLTPRQREVLQLIAEGHTRRKIAEMLHISPKTVSRHREDLMRRLAIGDQAGLILFAVSQGLVEL